MLLRNKFSGLSIILSLICIFYILKINYDMSVEYHLASGKTQALFGLKYLGRYYLGFLGAFGIVFSIIAYFKKERLRMVVLAFFISMSSVIITFIDLWKYLI